MYRTRALSAIGMLFLILPICASADEQVVNGNFSAGNLGFASAYSFVPNGSSTNPGQYAIVTDPSIDLANGYPSFKDHTTASGKMLLGDGTPGIPLWSQSVPVAAGGAYTFSVWVTAAIGPFPPIVRFTANGVPLGADMAVSASAGTWQHFTAAYTNGVATTVLLRIEDVRTGAPTGNDLAVDDVSLDGPPEVPPVPFIQPAAGVALFVLLGLLATVVIRKRAAGTPIAL